MAQCAHGAITLYGDKHDYKYLTNTSWNARRDSLTGEGDIKVSASHWINDVLDPPLPDASGGGKQFSYMQAEAMHMVPVLPYFETGLLDNSQMLTLKLQVFSRLGKALEDVDSLPTGLFTFDELVEDMWHRLSKLPAATLAIAPTDIVLCADSHAGQETIFDYMFISHSGN